MKRNALYTLMITALMLGACSTAKEPTSVWVNKEKIEGKSFSNIFIVVMTADVRARVRLESDLAAEVVARGLKAVKSLDVLPVSIKDPKTPSKEEVVSKVKESGCDAVFVASLLKKEESVRHTSATSTYTVLPYYSYTGTYYGYYSNWYPTVSTPGYYSHDKSYFMQSNLYDVASEEIMWSAQSKVFSPGSLEAFSKSYISTLIKQLEKEALLKK